MYDDGIWNERVDRHDLQRSYHSPLGVHIDNFVIARTNQHVLDSDCARLLDAFEGTHEGALQHYLGM